MKSRVRFMSLDHLQALFWRREGNRILQPTHTSLATAISSEPERDLGIDVGDAITGHGVLAKALQTLRAPGTSVGRSPVARLGRNTTPSYGLVFFEATLFGVGFRAKPKGVPLF